MSRRRIRRHSDVADDVVEQATFIAKDSLSAGLKYWDAAEATLRWLLSNPGAGHRRDFGNPRLANVPSWPVKGFRNHLILYEVEQGGINVLAIVHGARDLPRVLAGRLG